ncbi:sugar phosphate isomerase/epimerase [Oceanobacillus arenosus]|uniref:Sugar phosphate isomerase/epimerase n=1 Tax=Oceanobacillus arenosus TaxID=1229153 RepID=A0A3D8Q1M4_9BACI|nr:sugar phosphate isomerase/epimerase [Oceanobacillus arenosus]RDW22184.1 sugar phosphate isomerase/epimerase [Oceanobacillus arenosus]
MKNIPIGLQLYTLRDECHEDFVGTLEKVAKIGYDGVEFAGYGGLNAVELRKLLEDLGLKAASSHVSLSSLELKLDVEIEYQHILGNNHIVCPYLPLEWRTQEAYYKLISILNEAGKRCYEAGITLCYHNHDFELIPLEDGKKPLELLLKETNPEWVQTEFDVYWLTKAGEDPIEWIKRYHNRTPLIHLKDMTTDEERFFAELGTGGVNIDGVIKQASNSNVEWLIVEQDQCRRSPLESIELSLNYLK